MLLWTMCISLEILVITYLFPTLKYDILITSSVKADFSHRGMNLIYYWSEEYGCKLQEIMKAAN